VLGLFAEVASVGWLFVADDLTGACDVVAPFAPALVLLDPLFLGGQHRIDIDSMESVVSVCVPARNLPERAEPAVELVLTAFAAGSANGGARRVFVKVDSAGRSPYAEMVRAASTVGRPLVCPALPAQGRSVVDGWICIDGRRVLDLRSAVGGNGEVVDAVDDAGLDRLADRIRRDEALVPVGSAGLARALSDGSAVRSPSASNRYRFDGPVLVVVGSRHEAARSQVLAAKSVATVLTTADSDRFDALTELVDVVESRFDGHGLVLTGGDTALAVLRRLGVTRLRIDTESERGVPVGVALDGRAAGCPIALKSGGFGDSGTLERMVCAISPQSSVSSNRYRFDADGLQP
jgi:D-threonate/D-erythronate kinase